MSVTIPYTFVGGTGNKARAAEVNANFSALASKFTEGAGGIKNEDIATVAAIRRTKLSTNPGERITEAQMEDDAVDLRVLKDDATAGAPNAAVNNANHIKDGIVTGLKLATGAAASNLGAASVALDRLKITVHSVTLTNPSLGDSGGVARTAANPTSTFAKATYELVAIYVKQGTGGSSGRIFNALADDTGTNWAGWLYCNSPGGTGTVAGTVIVTYVFATRT